MTSVEFKEIYENSEYCDTLSLKFVRTYLRDKKLTKCNLGTTDYAKKVEGKTQKVIAFYKKELEKKVKQN